MPRPSGWLQFSKDLPCALPPRPSICQDVSPQLSKQHVSTQPRRGPLKHPPAHSLVPLRPQARVPTGYPSWLEATPTYLGLKKHLMEEGMNEKQTEKQLHGPWGELNSGHHLCSNELVQAQQNSEDSNWRIPTLLST